MKLVIGTAVIAASLVTVDASLKAMTKSYNELIKQTRKNGDRNILNTSIRNINQYGCWCYFDGLVGNGKGEPMDLIDAECRNLHRGYECIVADHGASCVPWEVNYFPIEGQSYEADFGSINAACIHTNTVLTNFGDCAAAACSVETSFIQLYTSITQTYNPQFPVYGHDGVESGALPGATDIGTGTFKPERNCVTNDIGTKDETPRECCGTYPERFPYKTYGNAKRCCGGSVYVDATHKCCNGNDVTLNGVACT